MFIGGVHPLIFLIFSFRSVKLVEDRLYIFDFYFLNDLF